MRWLPGLPAKSASVVYVGYVHVRRQLLIFFLRVEVSLLRSHCPVCFFPCPFHAHCLPFRGLSNMSSSLERAARPLPAASGAKPGRKLLVLSAYAVSMIRNVLKLLFGLV